MNAFGFAGLVLALCSTGVARSQPLDDAGLHTYQGVALSPSGDRVASVDVFQPFVAGLTRPRGPVVIRMATGSATGGTTARATTLDPCPACRYAGLSWSPDGARLAFIASDPARATATLELAEGGRVRAVATLDGVAQTPRWSPDGGAIALLATAGAHKQTGAVEAGAAQVGEIDAEAGQDEQRIAVVAATGGHLRYVSPADTFVYEYAWTPDGRGFVATAAKGDGDDNWWIAKLIGVDLATGAARTIAEPAMQMNFPRVSPDGGTVAFIGGLMSDFASVGGDLYTVPLAGGAPTNLTPGIKATFTALAWTRGGLRATLLRGDQAQIAGVDPRSGAMTTAWSQPVTLNAGDGEVSFDADGRLGAASRQDFTHPPEIIVGPLNALAPLTRANVALTAQVSARSVRWKSDGFDVQGWLLGPAKPFPGKRPMVVVVHGGPSSASTPIYVSATNEVTGHGPIQDLTARGYYVLQPNPRGSYGQGEAFTRANVRDFGGGDLKDILAGVDAVETIAPVDDARLGLFGHSYGGFMTMWTVAHAHRFRAAVAGAGIADWISYYGENGIDKWMIPFFGASAYDDPAIYTKLSPLSSIKSATTPTLIYVGEHDVECPAPQSFEFWRGLKAVGVPTSLVVYAGQGHAIRSPAALADLRAREVAWFGKWLGQ